MNLSGDNSDLEEIAKLYQTGIATVIKKNDRYILLSELFESLRTYEEVRKTAEDLITKINGSMRLIWRGFGRIGFHSVAGVNEKGKFCVTVPLVLQIVEPPPKEDKQNGEKAGIWLKIADIDGRASKLLSLLSSELDWVTLYRISEVIHEDQGDKIIDKGWVTMEDIKRFRATANSCRAIGNEARHAREKDAPPPNPMTLNDAQALLRDIANKWLQEKATKLRSS